jgi:hypothetical protein
MGDDTNQVDTAIASSLSDKDKIAVAQSILNKMWDRDLTKKDLINLTGLSKDTVYEALNLKKPQFSEHTLFKFERALQTSFRNKTSLDKSSAPEEMGGYTLKTAKPYIGEYIYVRPAFENPSNLLVYEIEIGWEDNYLFFQEKNRKDARHTQRGKVYLPPSSPVVNLVTIAEGYIRHIILSQIDNDGIMRGLIQTLFNPFANAYIPASAPVVMRRKTSISNFQLGTLDEKHRDYKIHRDLIEQAAKNDFFKIIPLGAIAKTAATDVARHLRGA